MASTKATVNFLRFARDILRDEQPEKYAALVDILTKQGRSAVEVRSEVEELLHGETLLIKRLNVILPPEHRILSQPEFDMNQAFDLVLRIRERSRDHEGLYQSFIDFYQMFASGQKPALEVTREISALLQNHADLQHDFLRFFRTNSSRFFPELGKTTPPDIDEAKVFFRRVQECLYQSFLDLLLMFRNSSGQKPISTQISALLKNHPDLQRDFLRFLPPEKATADFLTEVTRSTVEVRKEVEELLRRQQLLSVQGSNALLPAKLNILMPEVDVATAFLCRAKERLRDDDDAYQSFRDLLLIFGAGQMTRPELASEISALYSAHPDLQRDLLGFLLPEEAAAEFLGCAEIVLRDQPERFAALDNILTKDGRSAVDVRTEVEELLHGQPLLVYRFNALLPPELRITTPEIGLCKDFLRRTQEYFRDEEDLFKLFMDLVTAYRTEPKPFLKVISEIMDLLNNHPDVLYDFFSFLTPTPPNCT